VFNQFLNQRFPKLDTDNFKLDRPLVVCQPENDGWRQAGGEERQGGQGRQEQKFFPIITRQNKFDELLEIKTFFDLDKVLLDYTPFDAIFSN
jgi:hypothetical protein